MVNISIQYTGDLHCDAVHGPSKAAIATDAPTDNKGKGESFSPTDLVATALGTCMSTILAMAAQEHGLDVKGMTLLMLTLIVATLSLGTGRTTVLQGAVHLVIFTVYLFTTVVP